MVSFGKSLPVFISIFSTFIFIMSSSRAFKSAAAFQMLLLSRQSICRGFSTQIFLNQNAKYLTFGTNDMRIRPFASSLLSKYSQTLLYSSKEDEEKESNNDFEPTWTYTPYKPPPKKPMGGQQRRYYKKNDDWFVPKKITIPEDKLEISFARSSGKLLYFLSTFEMMSARIISKQYINYSHYRCWWTKCQQSEYASNPQTRCHGRKLDST